MPLPFYEGTKRKTERERERLLTLTASHVPEFVYVLHAWFVCVALGVCSYVVCYVYTVCTLCASLQADIGICTCMVCVLYGCMCALQR